MSAQLTAQRWKVPESEKSNQRANGTGQPEQRPTVELPRRLRLHDSCPQILSIHLAFMELSSDDR